MKNISRKSRIPNLGLPRSCIFLAVVIIFLGCVEKKWHEGVEFTLDNSQLKPYENSIDHVTLIKGLNDNSYKNGERTYQKLCHNCHGNMVDEASLPTAHKFWNQKFKVGNDPYSMYQTITKGFGLMPPQVDLTPKEKHEVIHFIREKFIKNHNKDEYSIVHHAYLESLPEGDSIGPEPKIKEPWAAMDYGNFLINTYELVEKDAPERERFKGQAAPLIDQDFSNANMAYKGIAIRLDQGEGGVSKGKAWVVFDEDLFRLAGGWTGNGFIDWNGILLNGKHGIAPRTVGELHFDNPVGPGWADPISGGFEDPRFEARDGRKFGPLPKKWGKYKGLYHYEDHIILSYDIGESNILEEFGIESYNDTDIFTRTLNITSNGQDLKMRVAPQNVNVALIGTQAELKSENGFHVLSVPPSDGEIKIKLLISKLGEGLGAYSKIAPVPISLQKFTTGGRAHYNKEIITETITLNTEGPFSVDVLSAPKENKWNSRIKMSGIDFMADGNSAFVCTTEGEVWRVKGLLEKSGKLYWKKIASGLFQPLGIKVIKDQIFVGCRDQIVLLRDLNNDEETDFYECFNNDHQVTEHFHEFAMGLQADQEGNLYYAKSARHAREAIVPQHGTLLKVRKDGSSTEIIASGFRAANGVCINPDGSFLVTDQEGHWNPMNRINWVERNKEVGFYGNMFGYSPPKDSSDLAMIAPMAWVDKKMDRSPAELLWVDSEQWGPLNGSLLSLSYGYGQVFIVPYENVNGQRQAGLFQLPIPDLPTGIMRGRFNPLDGQLYVCGMSAWGTQQMIEPGGLYRIKYSGKPVFVPIELNASQKGLLIKFATRLDPKSAQNIDNYTVKTWDLKRSREYGSEHYNEKELYVKRITLLPDQQTINMEIPGIKATWQMEVNFKLNDHSGKEVKGTIQNTVYNLGD
ncbi:c-type cytochrome [Arenibacter sp. M-2]|uniref:DUF6797 domain-containing protein n=1 Tax=Arenibacter sp. M-2 TaxID=3053612 RepID=UPI002570D221|nr:DUF6797 domain-containing protein [Arenibacter sp. M-2]MDL5512292.1 c-type cytochrome [Arenibacter sp. M-2]